MLGRLKGTGLGWVAAFIASTALHAQTPPSEDPIIRELWREGIERSDVGRLSQVLLDSLGPRLTGTPESEAASRWVAESYRSWGIEARQETYGTWMGWKRGLTSVSLMKPRVRALEGTMLAWSPGTDGPVTGAAIRVPHIASASDLQQFFSDARGRFILLSAAEPSCRPAESWQEWAADGSRERLQDLRASTYREWAVAILSAAPSPAELIAMLEDAGAAGILTSRWAEGWGIQTVYDTWSRRIPTLDLSCEDYGLVFRLATNGQSPVLRVDAESESLGEVPVWNTVGVIPGVALPDEYVVLSAHFDSWDTASGATDNGTGTVVMMEAMRILKAAYPNPRRTLIVGHWNGEEQGLNGSRAFAADHPEIVDGLQVLFNQDEGTGRVVRVSMQGLTQAGGFFRDWFARMPRALTEGIELVDPGVPAGGGSDDASFVCAGAPAFRLTSLSWDYGPYTWHTNRDTFDKLVLDDVKHNATLVALLAYLASEEPRRIPRDRVSLSIDPATGQPTTWPACNDARRSLP